MNNPEFKNLSIIICTSDETLSLAKTVDTLVSTNREGDISQIILCYPDFVTDDCLETVRQLEKRYANIPVVPYAQKKKGIGNGLRECIDIADGSHIVIMDSDGSRDIETVSRMVESVKAEPQYICKTSRKLKKGSFHDYGKIQFIMNGMGQLLLKCLYGPVCTDMTDALQIVPAALYKNIRWEETGFPFFMEMVLKPMRLGCKYRELPVNCYGRQQGVSHNGFSSKIGYLRIALKIRFQSKDKIMKGG